MWVEGKEGVIKLLEERPEIVRLFLQFALTGAIHSQKEGDTDSEGNDEE